MEVRRRSMLAIVRAPTAIVLFSCLVGCGSGARSSGTTTTEPGMNQTQPASGAEGELDIARLRRALADRGAGLSDEDVAFIHHSLSGSDTEYTERGLETFLEWGLVAAVTATPVQLTLMVAPTTGRVNADWELFIDRSTGAVTEGAVGTIEEPPPD